MSTYILSGEGNFADLTANTAWINKDGLSIDYDETKPENLIDLGYGDTGRQDNAGKIGYKKLIHFVIPNECEES